MNIYRSYLQSQDANHYDGWQMFSTEFPEIVSNDLNLKQLISKNVLINDKWNEIADDIKYSIEEELIWLGYSNSALLTEKLLYNLIIDIADNTLKASFLKSISINDQFDFDGLPQSYYFLEDGKAVLQERESIEDLEASESNVEELKLTESAVKNFRLDRDFLLNELKYWNSKSIIVRPIINRTPIITKVDYFDPVIYDLIKKDPELLKTLDWRIFEEMLADILKTFGYSIELTKRTKDGGIDVIAIKSDTDFGLHKYILQAKRYTKAVQVSPVRELMFLHNDQRASKSCLATTSTFTKGAWEMAEKYRWTLELKDKDGLMNWIQKVIDIRKGNGFK